MKMLCIYIRNIGDVNHKKLFVQHPSMFKSLFDFIPI